MRIDITVEQVKRLCRVTGISIRSLMVGTTAEETKKIDKAIKFLGLEYEETRYRKRN